MTTLNPAKLYRCWFACIAVLFSGCGKPSSPAPDTSVKVAAQAPTPVAKQNAAPFFEEIAAQAGLKFVHDSGAKGDYFMPEQTGSGAALFDFDNDGLLDVYLVQCGGPDSKSKNQLFRQKTPFQFENVSEGSGLDVTGYGMGLATGDFNNDGWIDLVLTEYGRTRLFANLDGKRFEDVTAQAGIDNSRWGTACSFLDYDRDGWLDLVVASYLDYNPSEKCFDAANQREYCGPQSFQGTVTKLYRNAGSSQPNPAVRIFEDVTVKSGFAKALGPALGILCADFNGDRWPDVFLSDDGRPNRLFINQKNGTFTEEAANRGVAFTGMGAAAANMGVAVGDVNRDGMFDFFVTHLATEQHTFWVQRPRGLFMDETGPHGLVNPKWKGTGFGAVFGDFDQDGFLDLAFVNGAVKRSQFPGERLAGLDSFWHPYAQRNQLFRSNGNGKFSDISENNPAFSGRATVGRGLAMGDIDNDGAIDLLSMNTGAPTQLFKNIAAKHGASLIVKATDPSLGNRDAIGAEIIVETDNGKWWGLCQTSYSYLSASDSRVHFGVGNQDANASARVLVIWPDGSEESFKTNLQNRFFHAQKGQGSRL